jgi:hypothetical protein
MKDPLKELKEKNKALQLAELKKLDQYIEDYRADKTLGSYEENDGQGTIYLDLSKDSIYKEYSGDTLLNNDIYDFIEDTYSLVPNKTGISLSFRFPSSMTKEEREKIIKLYRTHYAVRYKAIRSKIRKQRISSIALLFIGIIFLIWDVIFKIQNPDSIYVEVIDIFAWVFIWQAGDIFIFNSFDDSLQAKEYLRLFTAQIKES